MYDYQIRPLEAAKLKDYYPRIERDFAFGEYPPLDVLSRHMQEGRQEGYVLCDGTIDLAYSICAASPARDYVLISLFAVFQEYRGQGIGSTLLHELHKIYAHKFAIIGEVERPEKAKTADEKDKRLRRIAFYEKAGYRLIKGIDYTIWDIPMHLMALSLSASDEMINREIKLIMYQIYYELLGRQFINKMQFKEMLGENHEST